MTPAAAGGNTVRRRRWLQVGGAVALAGVAAAIAQHDRLGRLLGGEADLRVIEQRDTAFGRLAVVERDRKRYLAYGPGAQIVYQSVIDLDRPHELAAAYMRLMMLGMAYTMRASTIALIGAGAGNMAVYLNRHLPDAVVHAVDIDRHAVELGVRHFGLVPGARLQLHIADGRQWLQDTPLRFDLILLDAYDGSAIPPALRDAGFFALVAGRLAPGGVAMQNVYVPGVDLGALLAALRPSLPAVDGYRIGDSAVLAAHAGAPRDPQELARNAAALDARMQAPHRLVDLLGQRIVLP